jgi:hypothetical protein
MNLFEDLKERNYKKWGLRGRKAMPRGWIAPYRKFIYLDVIPNRWWEL